MNRIGQEAFNYLIVAERKLPWLQDAAEQAVWTKWGVTYRDLRIVDSQGRLHGVFNLTEHDLSISTNYATLKQMFLNVAQVVDSGGDHLADDWEMIHFGNLSAQPFHDSDHDGSGNFTEFAFGTDPLDPKSSPRVSATRLVMNQAPFVNVTFRRRAGAWLDYFIEQSSDLRQWFDNPTALTLIQESRNLFDGTGCLEVTCSIPVSTTQTFFRLRAASRR